MVSINFMTYKYFLLHLVPCLLISILDWLVPKGNLLSDLALPQSYCGKLERYSAVITKIV